MFKKITPILLILCLILSVSISASGVNAPNTQSAVSQQMPTRNNRQQNTNTSPIPGEKTTPTQNHNASQNNQSSKLTPPNAENVHENRPMPGGMREFGGIMPQGGENAQAEPETGFIGFIKTYQNPIISLITLILAFVFVIFYKRKIY